MEINYHYEHAMPTQLQSHQRYNNRIGFWGDVSEVNSSTNTCTVISDQGLEFQGIQIATREWINADKNKDYVCCEKNLPTIGSRVFVLVPNNNITSAFVLCSGYPINENDTQVLFTKVDENKTDEENQKEIEKKNIIREKITQSGWYISENYETGNLLFESNDKTILLEININKDDENSKEKEILVKVWDNEIKIIPDDKEIKLNILENHFSIKENEFEIENKDNLIQVNSKGVNINNYLSISAKE